MSHLLGSTQQGSSQGLGSELMSGYLVFFAVCLSVCFIIFSPCRRSGRRGIRTGHSYGGGEWQQTSCLPLSQSPFP